MPDDDELSLRTAEPLTRGGDDDDASSIESDDGFSDEDRDYVSIPAPPVPAGALYRASDAAYAHALATQPRYPLVRTRAGLRRRREMLEPGVAREQRRAAGLRLLEQTCRGASDATAEQRRLLDEELSAYRRSLEESLADRAAPRVHALSRDGDGETAATVARGGLAAAVASSAEGALALRAYLGGLVARGERVRNARRVSNAPASGIRRGAAAAPTLEASPSALAAHAAHGAVAAGYLWLWDRLEAWEDAVCALRAGGEAHVVEGHEALAVFHALWPSGALPPAARRERGAAGEAARAVLAESPLGDAARDSIELALARHPETPLDALQPARWALFAHMSANEAVGGRFRASLHCRSWLVAVRRERLDAARVRVARLRRGLGGGDPEHPPAAAAAAAPAAAAAAAAPPPFGDPSVEWVTVGAELLNGGRARRYPAGTLAPVLAAALARSDARVLAYETELSALTQGFCARAAPVAQRAFRGAAARWAARARFAAFLAKVRCAAAAEVQRAWRGAADRGKRAARTRGLVALQRFAAAVTAQRRARAWLGTRRVARARHAWYGARATAVQCLLRRYLAVLRAAERRAAVHASLEATALLIQRVFRGKRGKDYVTSVRQARASGKIARAVRGWLAQLKALDRKLVAFARARDTARDLRKALAGEEHANNIAAIEAERERRRAALVDAIDAKHAVSEVPPAERRRRAKAYGNKTRASTRAVASAHRVRRGAATSLDGSDGRSLSSAASLPGALSILSAANAESDDAGSVRSDALSAAGSARSLGLPALGGLGGGLGGLVPPPPAHPAMYNDPRLLAFAPEGTMTLFGAAADAAGAGAPTGPVDAETGEPLGDLAAGFTGEVRKPAPDPDAAPPPVWPPRRRSRSKRGRKGSRAGAGGSSSASSTAASAAASAPPPPQRPAAAASLEAANKLMPFVRSGGPLNDTELVRQVAELSRLRTEHNNEIVAMIEKESEAEEARAKELRFMTSEEPRKWVTKRQARARRTARGNISRVRHDNELVLMRRMVEYGFIR